MKKGNRIKKVLYGTDNLAKPEAWEYVESEKETKAFYITFPTPIAGRNFWVLEYGGRITAANFYASQLGQQELADQISRFVAADTLPIQKETLVLQEARVQLEEYFAGGRREFFLPVALYGTDFQLEDWQALCTIPYGETRSYGELAAQIGRPKASRAVGMANHNNPISVIVPCHRVIGAGGTLVGYGGGLDVKEALLKLEKNKNPT